MLRRTLFLLLVICPLPLRAQTDADPAELERINTAIAKVQQELAGTRSERSTVATDIQTSEKAILANLRMIDSVQASITEQQTALEELHARQAQLDHERSTQQDLIAGYVKGAWMTGSEEYLKLVLNQEDPRRSARMVSYYRYFSAARAARIAAFNRTLEELVLVADAITASAALLEQQQATLAEEQESLAASQLQRQEVLTGLDADLASRDAELRQLERDKIEIELLLDELQNSLADIPLDAEREPFANRKGQLIWPLNGSLINTFGTKHSLGDLTWEGVTIGATAGADIRAIHHGRVIFADWFNTSGLLLIIDHGDGYMSLYAHNQELFKTVGEWVASGEVIAAAGNTGGQREPSLYFEIRRNGRAENPVNWCIAR